MTHAPRCSPTAENVKCPFSIQTPAKFLPVWTQQIEETMRPHGKHPWELWQRDCCSRSKINAHQTCGHRPLRNCRNPDAAGPARTLLDKLIADVGRSSKLAVEDARESERESASEKSSHRSIKSKQFAIVLRSSEDSEVQKEPATASTPVSSLSQLSVSISRPSTCSVTLTHVRLGISVLPLCAEPGRLL